MKDFMPSTEICRSWEGEAPALPYALFGGAGAPPSQGAFFHAKGHGFAPPMKRAFSRPSRNAVILVTRGLEKSVPKRSFSPTPIGRGEQALDIGAWQT